MIQESELLYEQSEPGRVGVDLEPLKGTSSRTGKRTRTNVGLPSCSEPQVMRHFVRISQQNFSIDTNFYPLGSCTMKHNPRLNEKIARLPGFANVHPLQPESTVQGALEVISKLQKWLTTLTGLPGITLNPAAGAQGETTGMMVIKAALEAKGENRKVVLIPDAAHGTNPATAAMCGYKPITIPSDEGLVDMAAFEAAVAEHGSDIAAFMLTNPNTCGLFEPNIKKIADKLHEVGAYFYCDGANFNAIVGKVRPADVGVDVMQFNLHKTFSTPHGGGGPGSGPVVTTTELADFLPTPHVKKTANGYTFVEPNQTIGRIKGFHGHFGMFSRGLTYMLSHGTDGLQRVAEEAVLNANYIMAKLRSTYRTPYNPEGRSCMHECLLNDKFQKEKGVATLDIAKALIDRGIHPMTIYFPLVTPGAMLIEPTESEPKEVLDGFIEIMQEIAAKAEDGTGESEFHNAPTKAQRRRLDEVKAAKQPVLNWQAMEKSEKCLAS